MKKREEKIVCKCVYKTVVLMLTIFDFRRRIAKQFFSAKKHWKYRVIVDQSQLKAIKSIADKMTAACSPTRIGASI
jgi:hypothetical protein